MKIRIGTFITLGGDSKYQLSPPITGLGSAAIRNGDGLYAGKDGGYVSSQFYGKRTLVFSGFCLGGSCQETQSWRTDFLNKLRIRYNYPIFIEDFSGHYYYTEGYLTDVKADITGPKVWQYQITFLCSDPLIYDGGNGSDVSTTWITESIELGANTIVNPGFDYEPIITLEGEFDNPILTNVTTGKFFALDGVSVGTGESLVIDMKNRTVVLEGESGSESLNAYRTIDSSWWSLARGTNDIGIEVDIESGTTVTGEITYRKGYLGI